MSMSTTPAGPTLSGETDSDGDPIVVTGSGMTLTNQHLIVLESAARNSQQSSHACGSFPQQAQELQRDLLLSTDNPPTLFAYGYNALVLAGWL